MAAVISYYKSIKDTIGGKDVELKEFIEYVREGYWQDYILPLRASKENKTELKKKLPYVTISGKFKVRNNNGLEKHSGFLAIDFDLKCNPNILDKRDVLYADKYTYAGFISASGEGVCILVRIDGGKHLDAFLALEQYYFTHFDLIVDTSCKDVSRPRYVSYDPELYLTDKIEKFTDYLKEKAPKKIDQVVFVRSDFEAVLKDIQDRGIDLVDSYYDWMRTGFAIADKFGEDGRSYFHILSSQGRKYNPSQCDRQYDNCLRNGGTKIAQIATFYYLAKQAGLNIYSDRTKKIVNASVQGREMKRTPLQVADSLRQFAEIEGAEEIIKQVFDSNIQGIDEENLIEQVEIFLKMNYSMRRNEITRYIEDSGVPLKQSDFNSIFIEAKKIYDKLSYELLDRIINSNFTPSYNPILEYFKKPYEPLNGFIDSIADTIKSDDYLYVRHFFKKWLVSVIASAHGTHSPLMFVLAGDKQGTGKTEFFRRLLPKELHGYYAESKLDAGKDDEILMTQKLIIADDEMGGKSKKDEKRLKEMLSKQTFSLREPYGRNNVDLQRLAVLCGSTNIVEILSDTTGNRRIIPVQVYEIDNSTYNMIDKEKVILEAYNLFKEGFDWRLSSTDVAVLNGGSEKFEIYTSEYELISKFFRKPKDEEENYLTATEIKNILETKTIQKIILDRIGKELKRLGYNSEIRKRNGVSSRLYNIIEKGLGEDYVEPDVDLPF